MSRWSKRRLGRKMLRSGSSDRTRRHRSPVARHRAGLYRAYRLPGSGRSSSAAGRIEEAVSALERGIDACPYTPVLYKSLALRYINLKRYAEAKKTLERYVELFPEDDFVRGLLLKVRSELHRR